MSHMNVARILIGGMVAGLIINIGEAGLHAGVLGTDTALLYENLEVPAPNPGVTLPILVGSAFLLGIVSVWLYAAIRPRFGAGPKTALIAGIAVWLLVHVWSGVYLGIGYSGIFPARLAWMPLVWGLFEAAVATLAGAALYNER